eukprot:8329525-Pyramimonas_sp.AAC.1
MPAPERVGPGAFTQAATAGLLGTRGAKLAAVHPQSTTAVPENAQPHRLATHPDRGTALRTRGTTRGLRQSHQRALMTPWEAPPCT